MRRNFISKAFSILLAASVLTACGNSTNTNESAESVTIETDVSSETVEAAADTSSDEHIKSVRAITNVYGDGQKLEAMVIEYDDLVDPASLDLTDFRIASVNVSDVDNYEITNLYTNSEASLNEDKSSKEGKYVIAEVSTDYILTQYGTGDTKNSGSSDGPDISEKNSGGEAITGESEPDNNGAPHGQIGMASASESNVIEASLIQTGDISTLSGTVYTASETEYSNDSSENINLLVDDFEQLVYTAEDGTNLMYNLYIPKDYDENTSYPLVLFMPDATGTSSDKFRTLTQGLGGVIWASGESQEENPAIVLCPQYETDKNATALTWELLEYIQSEYNVDASRIYTTGQSAGTIRSIEMMIERPDYFAGAMLVAGQAEGDTEEKISELAGQNIWMIAATGDARALPGMTAIMEAVESEGTEVTEGTWSAVESIEDQDAAAKAMEQSGTSFYFTVLSDVVPEGITDNDATEHMNTWRVAYSIDEIRNWLFAQVKE